MSADPEFENLVRLYYRDLYRFGLSLTGSEADACDLAQETLFIWAEQRLPAPGGESLRPTRMFWPRGTRRCGRGPTIWPRGGLPSERAPEYCYRHRRA